MPVKIYSSEDEANKQACCFFIKDNGLNSLTDYDINLIKDLIRNNKYYEAVLEINFLSNSRFAILPVVQGSVQDDIDQLIHLDDLQRNKNKKQGVSLVKKSNKPGATCRKCKSHNSYASSDNNDGMFTCYACRKP